MNLCELCDIELKTGIAIHPVHNIFGYARVCQLKTTIKYNELRLIKCLKCPNCGKSYFINGSLVENYYE